jgi:hypothetical protein
MKYLTLLPNSYAFPKKKNGNQLLSFHYFLIVFEFTRHDLRT